MKEITGLSKRIIEIDLDTRSFSTYHVPDILTKLFMGGKGLALKLFYDRYNIGTRALDPENIIVFHCGAYMGTGAPCSGRFAAVTRSPLTGLISTSSCGGPFGLALKTSGWDGMIIKGKADKVCRLEISSEGASFFDAGDLWGMETDKTQERLEKAGSGTITIGPAGENLVSYANIVSGHRFFGRTGMGAVMGSKNLKAVSAKGNEFKIVASNPARFVKIRKKFIADINRNPFTAEDYRKRGTASNVEPAIDNMMLPVNNFRDGTHPEAYKVSGGEISDKHTESYSTCKPCSILCGHKGSFNGKNMQVPEYETIGLLGTSLGIFDPLKIAEWNEICMKLGFDTISAGGTLAWAMEAGEKGLYNSGLEFGSARGIAEILNDIGYNRNMGKELGRGSRWMSDKYGGSEFAIQSKGLEAAAYDPRGAYGHALGLATANRGACHLSATIMTSQAFSGFSFRFIKTGNPFQVMFFEDLYAAINSMQTCQFTAYAVFGERYLVKYLPRIVVRIIMMLIPQLGLQIISVKRYYMLYNSIMGTRLNQYRFRRNGKRIHLLERYMNCREGLSSADDTLPERFLKEHRESDPYKRVIRMKTMLRKYYWYRGYDRTGIPGSKTLKRWKVLINA